MSQPRFATMTAALFVRNTPPSRTLVSMPHQFEEDSKAPQPERTAFTPRPASETERPHKVRIALSDAEFEAFGLAAVKRGISRQQILRGAVSRYLDELARDYGQICACLARGAGNQACGCNRAS
jgi:hypothetical protein